MFNVKSSDPLDGLVTNAEKILAERAEMLAIVAKAEANVAQSQAGLAAAQERVAREEFENAQREGGLAVASKAAQQSLAEAELQVKSTQYRRQGLQAPLKPIEERLLAAWAMVQRYQQDFIGGKIEALSAEFEETLKALVRLICRARVLGTRFPKSPPGKLHHPWSSLNGFQVSNPFTWIVYVEGRRVRHGDHMRDSIGHLDIEPEAVALRDALEGVDQSVMRLGVALKEAGLSGIEVKLRGGQEAVEEQQPDDGA